MKMNIVELESDGSGSVVEVHYYVKGVEGGPFTKVALFDLETGAELGVIRLDGVFKYESSTIFSYEDSLFATVGYEYKTRGRREHKRLVTFNLSDRSVVDVRDKTTGNIKNMSPEVVVLEGKPYVVLPSQGGNVHVDRNDSRFSSVLGVVLVDPMTLEIREGYTVRDHYVGDCLGYCFGTPKVVSKSGKSFVYLVKKTSQGFLINLQDSGVQVREQMTILNFEDKIIGVGKANGSSYEPGQNTLYDVTVYDLILGSTLVEHSQIPAGRFVKLRDGIYAEKSHFYYGDEGAKHTDLYLTSLLN